MREQERRDFGRIGQTRWRTIAWSFIVGLLLTIAWLTFEHKAQIGNSFSSAMHDANNPIAPLVRPIMQFGTLSQPTTILFMGTDVVYRDSKRRQVDPGSCQGNTDTMMLVFLNPSHNTVSVLNIPRDTEAYIGKWGVQKINSANPLGGPELAKATVSSLLDVRIDHYAVMNIHGLVEVVNELGGVTVEVPKKMNYMDWTGKLKIDLEPGFHALTGNQAMGFVRFRHDALGDIGRIQRQQMFLQAAVRKMLDPKSWLHLNALVDIAGRNTRTDLSNVDLFESLNFIHSVPRENIKFVMLPGEFGGNGDWLANTDGKALAQRLSDPDQESVTSRRNITVCIVNASSDRKLGGELSQALRKLGYITCVGKDDNDPVSSKTRIIAQNGNIANAKMMQQDLGGKGEVVNASVGNLMSSITIVAHDDLKLDEITMSTADAPYVAPLQRPQPLVDRPLSVPPLVKSSSAPLASADTDKQADIPSVLDGENEPDDKQAKPSISDDESKVGSDPKTAGDAKMGSDSKTAGDSTIGSEPNKSNDKQSSESPRTPSSETAKPAEAAGTSGTAEHSDALPGKSTSLPPTAPLPKSEERLAEPNNGQAIPITR